jgi:hypothetical protein
MAIGYVSVREQCQLGAADQRLYCYLFYCVVLCSRSCTGALAQR